MTTQLNHASPSHDSPDDGSATDWWTQCSTAELISISRQGLAGGDRFVKAVAELEARALQKRQLAENELRIESGTKRKRKQRSLVALGIGLMVAVSLALLIFA